MKLSQKAPKTGMCLNLDACARAMSVLNDPSRLRVIRALFEDSKNVTEIAQAARLSMHRVSHHLGIMRLIGIVEANRQGRNIIYSVNSSILRKDGLDLGCCSIVFRSLKE